MSDRQAPTHSAAWHWEEAERYMSLASYMRDQPGPDGAKAVNTYDQKLWATLGLAHAQLAAAGATILSGAAHSKDRAALLEHAEGRGSRDVSG